MRKIALLILVFAGLVFAGNFQRKSDTTVVKAKRITNTYYYTTYPGYVGASYNLEYRMPAPPPPTRYNPRFAPRPDPNFNPPPPPRHMSKNPPPPPYRKPR